MTRHDNGLNGDVKNRLTSYKELESTERIENQEVHLCKEDFRGYDRA